MGFLLSVRCEEDEGLGRAESKARPVGNGEGGGVPALSPSASLGRLFFFFKGKRLLIFGEF